MSSTVHQDGGVSPYPAHQPSSTMKVDSNTDTSGFAYNCGTIQEQPILVGSQILEPQAHDSRFEQSAHFLRTAEYPNATNQIFQDATIPDISGFPTNSRTDILPPSASSSSYYDQSSQQASLVPRYKFVDDSVIVSTEVTDMTSHRGLHDTGSNRISYNAEMSPYQRSMGTPTIAHRTRGQQSPSDTETVGRLGRSSNSVEGDVTGAQPPWDPTNIVAGFAIYQGGVQVRFDLHASFEKSFFLSDDTKDWTCYRRNYFATHISYSMQSSWQGSMPYELEYRGSRYTIQSFAVCLRAVVDDAGGKEVPIVVHTPKRDKGPQSSPAKVHLAPKPYMEPYGGFGTMAARPPYHSGYDAAGQLPTEHFYERMQFKNATQNNGKRRAAQQYYHVIAELFADLGDNSPFSDRYFKMASKMSYQVVVRGRSPGHYRDNAKKDQDHGRYDVSDEYTCSRPEEDDYSSTFSHGLPISQPFIQGAYDHRVYQPQVGYPMHFAATTATKPLTPTPSDEGLRHAGNDQSSSLYFPAVTQDYMSQIQPAPFNHYQGSSSSGILPSTPSSLFSPPSSYRDTRANSHASIGSMNQTLGGPPLVSSSIGGPPFTGPNLNYDLVRPRDEMEGRHLPLLPPASALGRWDYNQHKYSYPTILPYQDRSSIHELPSYNQNAVQDPSEYGHHAHGDHT